MALTTEETRAAITSLTPKAEFSIHGTVITWYNSSITQPTTSELEAEDARLKADYINKKYQRDRKVEYPSISDQLDMQYWDKKNGTTTWVEAVDKVKSDNPKS